MIFNDEARCIHMFVLRYRKEKKRPANTTKVD